MLWNYSFQVRMDSGTWVDVVDGLYHTYGSLPDGQHTATVGATDTAGNYAEMSVTFNVQVPEEEPEEDEEEEPDTEEEDDLPIDADGSGPRLPASMLIAVLLLLFVIGIVIAINKTK